jgi:hypothetical protein
MRASPRRGPLDRPRGAGASRAARGIQRLAPLFVPALLLTVLVPPAAANGVSVGPPAYSAGQLGVAFPSPSPGIEIYSTLNASLSAELFVLHVLEIAPSTNDHPQVVALATPTVSSSLEANASGSTQSTFGLQLAGAVPVMPTNVPLWQNRDWAPPSTGVLGGQGGASLTVSYSFLPGADGAQGINVSWNIRNWPWRATQDLLGVELELVVLNSTGFEGCSASDSLANASGAVCPYTSLAPGTILWNSTRLGGIFATAPKGPTASFSWSAAENVSGMGPAPITAGAFYSAPGVTQITVVAPAGGSENVTAGGHLLLTTTGTLTPVLPLPAPLRANPVGFASAVALFAAAGLGGVLAYRRYDRKLRESL